MAEFYPNVGGKNVNLKVRRDVRNKRLWVYELWYIGREYPQVISERFTSKKAATEYGFAYIKTGKTKYLG